MNEQTTHTNTALAHFTIDRWDETSWPDPDRPQEQTPLRRAEATYTYTGDMEGTSRLTFMMRYLESGEAEFNGMEVFDGTLGGAPGTLILHHTGRWTHSADFQGVEVSWHIVEATGALRGTRGEGRWRAEHGERFGTTLHYSR